MSTEMTLNVRVSGPLKDFVAANVAEAGAFENVSEYVRHLIRSDLERTEQERFERLKAELTLAFSAPDESYVSLTADQLINRNCGRLPA